MKEGRLEIDEGTIRDISANEMWWSSLTITEPGKTDTNLTKRKSNNNFDVSLNLAARKPMKSMSFDTTNSIENPGMLNL